MLCSWTDIVQLIFNDKSCTLSSYLAWYVNSTAVYISTHHPYFLYRNLKRHFDMFLYWYYSWHIEINESWTAAIYFYRILSYSNKITNTTFALNGNNKYLGIILDKRLILNLRSTVFGASKSSELNLENKWFHYLQ